MESLQARGAEVAYYDPYVPVIRPTREHAHWAGTRSVGWDRAAIAAYDLVLIATNHACVDYAELAAWARCIVDTRNAMASVATERGRFGRLEQARGHTPRTRSTRGCQDCFSPAGSAAASEPVRAASIRIGLPRSSSRNRSSWE